MWSRPKIQGKAAPRTKGVAGTWEVPALGAPCPFLIPASSVRGPHVSYHSLASGISSGTCRQCLWVQARITEAMRESGKTTKGTMESKRFPLM